MLYIYICIIGAQLEGSGGRSPLPCFKNQKKCPDFGKKDPDFVAFWVKFSIWIHSALF